MAKRDTGFDLSRRRFLQRAGAPSLAGLAFPTIVPASVRGGPRGVAPGDKIAVALVGAGPQGQGVMKGFLAENIRDAFFAVYSSAVGSVLDTVPSHLGHCGVCHFDFSWGGTKNPYGNAVLSSGFALNTSAGRVNAINSLRGADPDGDGFITDIEVTNKVTYSNTPTFPGLTPGNVGNVLNVTPSQIQTNLVLPPAWILPLRRSR